MNSVCPTWFSNLIIVKTGDGELTEDVVHRDVAGGGATESPLGQIVNAYPLSENHRPGDV